ncbi:divalent metal cation transporter [Roseimaritima sediminicola]|uniref:divalent metal cation transporter n=1 Tax=Roseimaritima sediminicola TaxID=2662066 RepID=UPI00129854ED|nr:divalent metal cation transporter [Roseimaritima sediminicola]
MSTTDPFLAETEKIQAAQRRGGLAKWGLYTRLSGPGWLQGAITLGGGSLAGSLYLGVVMGYHLMWLQPLAMILGVIMLSAISYVTVSTGQRPFDAIKRHVSPALAWGWLVATMMANIVWCLPQFALGTAALKQNLVPAMNTPTGTYLAAFGLLIVATTVVWFYNSGNWGIKLFEMILKALVGMVVLCFFGVVIAMTYSGSLQWGEILAGFIPNPSYLFKPVPSMEVHVAATGDSAAYWRGFISNMQKDKIITAFATAVGINMTFLLPYSMLRKGWGKVHRELAIFDLSIGLIVPFVLATGCVVIASASQFHGNPDDVLALVAATDESAAGQPKEVKKYYDLVDGRLKEEMGDSFQAVADDPAGLAAARAALPERDRYMAAMLAERDNMSLAKTLDPLFSSDYAQKLFGVGVLGMAISTIIILMLINGFAFCEMIGVPPEGNMHRLGSMIPAVGVLGPFVWSQAAAALATPTSVIGGAMLPIAYVTFLLLMNSQRLLGDAMPRGAARWRWNILMVLATSVATFGSIWGLRGKTMYGWPIGTAALALLAVLLIVGIVSFLSKNRAAADAGRD